MRLSGSIIPRLARKPLAAALFLAALAAPASAEGQKQTAIFDISIRGIPAAKLSYGAAIDAKSYAVQGYLKSSGILAFVRKVRYDASVSGSLRKGTFTPARYSEKADTGKRQSESLMAYRGGVPQVKVYNPPRAAVAGDIDPATQGGTVDPLTALFAVLRDVKPSEACNLKLFLFDGRRRSQVVLGAPSEQDGAIHCAGEYRRLEGFSAKEMAEKVHFPFELTYGPAAEGLVHVTEISMDTLYGKGRMIRR